MSNIYYDVDKVENIMQSWTPETMHVVADFDRTLTAEDSKLSWELFKYLDSIPKEYLTEERNLYNYYRPIEVNMDIPRQEKESILRGWPETQLSLLKKYRIREDEILKVARDSNYLHLREGIVEFFKLCSEYKIPVIIISAGIGNFIEEALRIRGLMTENVYILSNFLYFENGVIKDFNKKIIYALNKDEHELPETVRNIVEARSNAVILGDGLSDLKMVSPEVREKSLAVGFLIKDTEEMRSLFLEKFDIVCEGDSPMTPVTEIIKKHAFKK